MNKRNVLIIAITLVLAIAAVVGALIVTSPDKAESKTSKKSETTTRIEALAEDKNEDKLPSTTELENMVKDIFESDDAEYVLQHLDGASLERAQELCNYYTGTEYEINLEYVTTYKQYLLYRYTAKVTEGVGLDEDAYLVFTKVGDEHKLCVAQDAMIDINEHFACSTCGGAGSISTGDTQTCGLCGGLGQQYVPNLYYDAALGWQGGTIACSGCGGAGHTGTVYSTCHSCGGMGIVIK